jgi:hypothetical protein
MPEKGVLSSEGMESVLMADAETEKGLGSPRVQHALTDAKSVDEGRRAASKGTLSRDEARGSIVG